MLNEWRYAMITLYDAPGNTSASYDAANQTVIAKWDNFPAGGHFRPCLEAQVNCVRNQGAKFVIVDVATTQGVPSQEDQQWLGEYVFPSYESAGLKAVVTIVPADALTRLGANRWQQTGSAFKFDMFEVASLEDAQACLQDLA